MRNLKLFIFMVNLAFVACLVHGMKDEKFYLWAAVCLGISAIANIVLIIKHFSREIDFMQREKRVYGRDISGTGVTLTLKLLYILLSIAGAVIFFFCCMKLGMELNGAEITKEFAGTVMQGPLAKWMYGAYTGLFMLILAVISLVSSLLYGVYRKNKNKKEGFAERNVNKEDLSWLLDVEYGVDEEENKK